MSSEDGVPQPAPDELRAELARLREENEALREEAETAAPSPDRGPRRRRRASVVLAVVAGLILPVAVLTIWSRNQLLDTNRYVATVRPLASDPEVTSAVVDRLSERISEEADYNAIAAELLPERAQPLSGVIASGAESLTHTVVERVVTSDQFVQVWDQANEKAHELVVAILRGKSTEAIDTADGQIVVNLDGLATQVLSRIDDRTGLNLEDRVPVDQLDLSYTLVDSPDLARLQSQVRLFDRLSWLTVILGFGALVAAIAVAEDRRRGLKRAAIALSISMFVMVLAYAAGRTIYLNNLPGEVQNPEAARSVFDTLTRFPHQAIRTLFVLGLVLLVATWLVGPSSAAERARGWWGAVVGRAGSRDLPLPGASAWLADHQHAVTIGILVVAGGSLVAWTRPTGWVVISIAVIALAAIGIVQLVAAPARRDPSGEPEPSA